MTELDFYTTHDTFFKAASKGFMTIVILEKDTQKLKLFLQLSPIPKGAKVLD